MPASTDNAKRAIAPRPPRAVSCGVLVTDGIRLLIGHATRSVRWDIPKGLTEAAEAAEDTARRELLEETGLAAAAALEPLGTFRYRPGKDLCLFAWRVPEMPDIATLHCRSTFLANGRPVPEFDKFDCPPWAAALPLTAPSLQAVLAPIATARGWL